MLRLCGLRISHYHDKVRIVLLEKARRLTEPQVICEYPEDRYPQACLAGPGAMPSRRCPR